MLYSTGMDEALYSLYSSLTGVVLYSTGVDETLYSLYSAGTGVVSYSTGVLVSAYSTGVDKILLSIISYVWSDSWYPVVSTILSESMKFSLLFSNILVKGILWVYILVILAKPLSGILDVP